jgi:YHS domain-containing protein
VSLLDDTQLARGSDEFTTVYRDVTLAFASAEHKSRFDADPERYWPAFDGYCPVSARDFRTSREGVPNLTAIYRGRIWFFAEAPLRRRFIASPQAYAVWATK